MRVDYLNKNLAAKLASMFTLFYSCFDGELRTYYWSSSSGGQFAGIALYMFNLQ